MWVWGGWGPTSLHLGVCVRARLCGLRSGPRPPRGTCPTSQLPLEPRSDRAGHSRTHAAMNPRVLCAALLCVAATALAKPQNFNSLSDANHFVVQAQPVSEGGSSAAGVPVFNGIPLTGPAALLAGDKSKFTIDYHQRLRPC